MVSNASSAMSTPLWDGLHELTTPINQDLLDHPRRADALLISKPK